MLLLRIILAHFELNSVKAELWEFEFAFSSLSKNCKHDVFSFLLQVLLYDVISRIKDLKCHKQAWQTLGRMFLV